MRIDFDSHRRDAELEDLLFLLDAGYSREVACARVGVAWDTIEKRVARARPAFAEAS